MGRILLPVSLSQSARTPFAVAKSKGIDLPWKIVLQ